MKTNKFLGLLLISVASLVLVSCVQDDDYVIPISLGDEENARLNKLLTNGTYITMAEAKNMYSSDPNGDGDTTDAIPFSPDENIYIKGYVSSSDKTGNFFKEFFIQDSPTNPTIAIKVAINQVDLYNQFNFGREVYVSLQGLFIGEERVASGVTTIGGGVENDRFGGKITKLNETRTSTHIFRSPVTEDIIPLKVPLSQIGARLVGVYVQVEDVEFADDLAGKRYFDPMEDFDTKRMLQDCSGFLYSELLLETSSFSNFKNELLPIKNGSISAVVNKTFDGGTIVLAVNSLEDVDMNNPRCSLLDIADFTAIYKEDFDAATDNTDLTFPGWINFPEAGSRVWREKFLLGNGYTEFSPFGSVQPSNIGWLVSPGINLTGYSNVYLNFKSAQHHLTQDSPENALEVFVSTDFDGTDVLRATWNPVSASLANESDDFYIFADSGLIDISAYISGTLYIAFKANGSGTLAGLAGSYMIDDLKILVN
ncbi:hypothetical protein BZARG_455 [Bizionia argentinensis JUB59]|uniref:DUF5689 domain-containing protein n=1 Tax=Bizionia argentinensis JUB59 TaxID=1046627 RepID=G2EH68_9FLAO|nr:DUF5689 domain-containing protein [Bizionia argentinensis]EGV42171.1 hypothetical protein BZARG_455 [Bizionia argentinensis JUB59]